MSRGILYIATGEEHLDRAIGSAEITSRSVDVPISIVTHREVEQNGVFDEVIVDEEPQRDFVDKPRNLPKTPYSKTLFLDADAYVISDINELWELLDYYDMAMAVDPNEGVLRFENKGDKLSEELPESLPEFNTGVILFNKSIIESLCQEWVDNYSDSVLNDQSAFRKTLLNMDLDFMSLSNNYNTFIGFPTQLCGEAKIVHDFFDYRDEVENIPEIVNASDDIRMLYFNRRKLHAINSTCGKITQYVGNSLLSVKRAKNIVEDEGFKTLVSKFKRKFSSS